MTITKPLLRSSDLPQITTADSPLWACRLARSVGAAGAVIACDSCSGSLVRTTAELVIKAQPEL